MTVTLEQISELKSSFYKKLNTEGVNEDFFHCRDIKRININNDWLQRFLIHLDGNVDEALKMLWSTLLWRKENNVNEINENTVNLDYIKDGAMYAYGKDIDGKILLVFRSKLHFKGQKNWEELKKCIIYWFERIERATKGDQITIFFDMADSGLSNMDMEFTQYLINLCKLYYPHFLNYILIFEMPWIMNATFKLVKSWLPAKAVEKIKFVNKSQLVQYVPTEYILTSWGGQNNFEFTFQPEEPLDDNENVVAANEIRKRVHFQDGNSGEVNSLASTSMNSADEDPHSLITSTTKVRISPADSVLFTQEKNGDVSAVITLTNLNTKSVAFKIKTTSPEKFRVRPGSGSVEYDESIEVCITVVDGVLIRDIISDKFLVQTIILQDKSSATDLVCLWKNIDTKLVDQHRLRCTIHSSVNYDNSISTNGAIPTSSAYQGFANFEDFNQFQKQNPGNKLDSLCHAVQNLKNQNDFLRKEIRDIKFILFFTISISIMLLAIVLFKDYKSSSSISSNNTCDISSIAQTTDHSSSNQI